ncbi:MAG: DUF1080 domain-containing protein [Clostridiales bacterium]|jgi:hypothetical protein|nr:DUF1080 domain-containing protein [Clostridiales bacterium]
MTGTKLKRVLLFTAGLLAAGLLAAPAYSASADETAYDYTQDFSAAASVNADFSAYYQRYTGGRSYAETVGQTDGHWQINDGELRHETLREPAAAIGGTEMFAILTYTGNTYLNFELSVDFTMGTESIWWPCVAFRQAEEGKSFFEDGAAVFLQREGIPTLWGGKLVGGPYEGAQIAGYSGAQKHNMRLIVQGNGLSLYVDGVLSYEKTLGSGFYTEGYISLISVNNNSSFDNFKVKALTELELPEPPAHSPKAPADGPDALDALAEDKTGETLIERDLDIALKDGAGCAGATGIISGIVAALAVVVLRKR